MSLNETASAERIHIGFFGKRNAGKSSLVNAVTNQEMSVVSPVKGTTTDTVRKAMELLPLGPVVIIDTPGIDDEGLLGEKRVAAANRVLHSCDIAVLCVECGAGALDDYEQQLTALFEKRGIPYVTALTKCDTAPQGSGTCGAFAPTVPDPAGAVAPKVPDPSGAVVATSAATGAGIEELKEALGACLKDRPERTILADIVKPGEAVVLVVPIDASAPKGRLILPQQLVLRELLDIGAMALVTKETELEQTLALMKEPPALVVTDSQVFHFVKNVVPDEVPLTSFSILMARYKGFLEPAVEGALLIDQLPDGAKILIAEGCTHHRQCEDIGTVKLPKLLKKFTGKEFRLEWSSGRSYPEDLDTFDLVLHCGGCMLNEREMQYRMRAALDAGVPFTNYGIAIAHMNGILRRSVAMLPL
ncbi:MAG: [FeFe] hydrogenase H-cluster maturation GTPase HydF [Lachnospiraceae bacterium]|nr:[FeFe] hydrogenase H-cluster maturation GTPase HydF [Lachnospiraceae bacterium]